MITQRDGSFGRVRNCFARVALASFLGMFVGGCSFDRTGLGPDMENDAAAKPDGGDTDGQANCGNGTLDPGEECDGDRLNDRDCNTEGFVGGELVCDAFCRIDTTACNNCGNGIIDGSENCDGTDLSGQSCDTRGYDGGELGCDALCNFEYSGCFRCGNAIKEPGEDCDASDLGAATCENQGQSTGTLRCDAQCNFDFSDCGSCGDGVCNPSEHGGLCPPDCTTVVFTEDFETLTTWQRWSTADDDGNDGIDTWDRSDIEVHGGSYSIWCAENGSESSSYDNHMRSWADTTVDLSPYAGQYIELEAWIWVDIGDSDDDFAFYRYDPVNANYPPLTPGPSNTSGWERVTYDISVGAGDPAFLFGVWFYSDGSSSSTMGAFVDDIVIRAIR